MKKIRTLLVSTVITVTGVTAYLPTAVACSGYGCCTGPVCALGNTADGKPIIAIRSDSKYTLHTIKPDGTFSNKQLREKDLPSQAAERLKALK